MATVTFRNNLALEMPEIEIPGCGWRRGLSTPMNNRLNTIPLVALALDAAEDTPKADILFTSRFASAMLLDEPNTLGFPLYFPEETIRQLDQTTPEGYILAMRQAMRETKYPSNKVLDYEPYSFDSYMEILGARFICDHARVRQTGYITEDLVQVLIHEGGIEIANALGRGKNGVEKLFHILINSHPDQREQITQELDQSGLLKVVRNK